MLTDLPFRVGCVLGGGCNAKIVKAARFSSVVGKAAQGWYDGACWKIEAGVGKFKKGGGQMAGTGFLANRGGGGCKVTWGCA